MAYTDGKSSTAYIGFFEGKVETSLPTQVAVDLERVLAKKEEHLRHMPKTPANVSKESAIHEARNNLRSVVGMMLLPPLVSKDSPGIEVTHHTSSPNSSSS